MRRLSVFFLILGFSGVANARLESVTAKISCLSEDGFIYFLSTAKYYGDPDSRAQEVVVISKHELHTEKLLARLITPGWTAGENSKGFNLHFDRLRFGGYANVNVSRMGSSLWDLAVKSFLEGEYDNLNVTSLNTFGVLTNRNCTWLSGNGIHIMKTC